MNTIFPLKHMPEANNYEMLIRLADSRSGLKAFIAIHSTALGPASGGTRMREYESEEKALEDALNLSRAMSYKCALAGVPFGGGKGVIMGGVGMKTKALLAAYAEKIQAFGGLFRTGTDVGITDADVRFMGRYTRYMGGIVKRKTMNEKYTTSAMAALGVFYGIQVCLKEKTKNPDVRGRTVAVKGTGKLGARLVALLVHAGARVIACDIAPEKIKRLKKKYPSIAISDPKTIHREKADVFAPCAFGEDVDGALIHELGASIVAGGANNQLVNLETGDSLHRQGVLYAPDYVINAGGLIHVCATSEKDGYNPRRVLARVAGIKKTLKRIFSLSKNQDIAPQRIADHLAEEKLYA